MSGYHRTGGNRRGGLKARKQKFAWTPGWGTKYMHSDGAPAQRAILLRGKFTQEKLNRSGTHIDERMSLSLADMKRMYPELCNVPKVVTLIDDSNKWNRPARAAASQEV